MKLSRKLLVELGADVNAANNDDAGLTAMHGAAFTGANEIVQFLADRGATLDRRWTGWGKTPLSRAEGDLPKIICLVDAWESSSEHAVSHREYSGTYFAKLGGESYGAGPSLRAAQ